MDSFHLDITSFDSKEDFPGNTGNNFRVKLSEPLALSGNWELVLTSLTLFLRDRDAADVLAGLHFDVYRNIAGYLSRVATKGNFYEGSILGALS